MILSINFETEQQRSEHYDSRREFGIFATILRVMPNSHRHSRHDKTVSSVCVASASAVWIGFPTTQDSRRQKIWSLNTFTAFVQLTPAHQNTTQTGPSCRVWRAVWIGHNTKYCGETAEYTSRIIVFTSLLLSFKVYRQNHVTLVIGQTSVPYKRTGKQSKCLPILLCGTDVCPMNSASRHSLQFTINKIEYKIFGAMSKDLYKCTLWHWVCRKFDCWSPKSFYQQIWRNRQLFMSLCCADWFICLTVFFYLLRLFNFCLLTFFIYVVLPHTMVK